MVTMYLAGMAYCMEAPWLLHGTLQQYQNHAMNLVTQSDSTFFRIFMFTERLFRDDVDDDSFAHWFLAISPVENCLSIWAAKAF
jgi:hypothetical protein